MSFLAGETVTAGRLNRVQPLAYQTTASGTLVGPQSGADVPGLSITFDTTADGATYQAVVVLDVDLTGATTGLASARIVVDGTNSSQFAVFAAEVSTDRATVAQTYQGTLGTAGSHTIKVAATPMTGQTINQYSSLMVTVFEVP
jgi:hypothetical protein